LQEAIEMIAFCALKLFQRQVYSCRNRRNTNDIIVIGEELRHFHRNIKQLIHFARYDSTSTNQHNTHQTVDFEEENIKRKEDVIV
jgi:hypothetical protein